MSLPASPRVLNSAELENFRQVAGKPHRKGTNMGTDLILVGALVFLLVLKRWILPKLGIPT